MQVARAPTQAGVDRLGRETGGDQGPMETLTGEWVEEAGRVANEQPAGAGAPGDPVPERDGALHRVGRQPVAPRFGFAGRCGDGTQDLGRHGITSNAVAPGFVRSNPSTERQWERLGTEGQARLVENVHTRRLGEAADIANAVLFLASDDAAWISGQILSVDGGRS